MSQGLFGAYRRNHIVAGPATCNLNGRPQRIIGRFRAHCNYRYLNKAHELHPATLAEKPRDHACGCGLWLWVAPDRRVRAVCLAYPENVGCGPSDSPDQRRNSRSEERESVLAYGARHMPVRPDWLRPSSAADTTAWVHSGLAADHIDDSNDAPARYCG